MNTQAIHRVTHEIKRRRLEVLRVVDITPRMRRIPGRAGTGGLYQPGQ